MSEVIFDAESHTYHCNGRELISVTKVIKSVIPEFDKDTISKHVAARDGLTQEEVLKQWEDASLVALAKGSVTHAYIEDLYTGRADSVVESCNDLPELRAFKTAWGNLQKSHDAKILQQELRLGDPELGVAGTVDCIAQLIHDFASCKHVFDWKTGKKFDSSNRYQKMLAPFQDLDSCHLNHYSLQTSIYRLMLERKFGESFGESYLIHLRTDGTHFCYRARDYRERVKKWLLSRA